MSKTLIAVSIAALLAACSTTSPDVVHRGDAQRLANVQDATVLSVRPVTVEGNQTGMGGATGAVIGNAIERSATREDAVEILLQLRNGERRAIVQAKAGETFNPGDPVVLVTTGNKTRVTRAPAGAQAVQPLPAPVQSQPRG